MSKQLGNTTYYYPQEVAIVINRSYETVMARIRDGKIDPENISGVYLVSHKELVRHLADYEALPESMIDARLNAVPVRNIDKQ